MRSSHFSFRGLGRGWGWRKLPGRQDTCVRSWKIPTSAPGGEGRKANPHGECYMGNGLEVRRCVCGLLPKLLLPYHMASLTSKNITDFLSSHRGGTKDLIPGSQPLLRCPPSPLSGRLGQKPGRDKLWSWIYTLPSLSQLSPAAQGGRTGHLERPTPT